MYECRNAPRAEKCNNHQKTECPRTSLLHHPRTPPHTTLCSCDIMYSVSLHFHSTLTHKYPKTEKEKTALYFRKTKQRNCKNDFVVKCSLTAFLLAARSPTLPSHWSSQRLLLTILLCSLALAFTIPLLCSL